MVKIEKEIADILKSRDGFLIASHRNPDGDAVGSSLALYSVLKELGKTVFVEMPTKPGYSYDFLEDYDAIELTSNTKDVGVVIAVDCAELHRCGLTKDYVKDRLLINIDHHKTNSGYGDINLVKADAAAVGCIIWDILKENGLPISKKTAEYLYLSILTDTGSFRYSSTSEKAFLIAADLLKRGVEPWYISSNVYEREKPETYKLLALVLDTLEFYYNGKLAIEYVTLDMFEKTNTTSDNTEGFVNYARSICGVEVGVLLREDEKNVFKISIRSKGKVDVSRVAERFDGGGHKNAAGGTIRGDLTQVKEKIIDTFRDLLLQV